MRSTSSPCGPSCPPRPLRRRRRRRLPSASPACPSVVAVLGIAVLAALVLAALVLAALVLAARRIVAVPVAVVAVPVAVVAVLTTVATDSRRCGCRRCDSGCRCGPDRRRSPLHRTRRAAASAVGGLGRRIRRGARSPSRRAARRQHRARPRRRPAVGDDPTGAIGVATRSADRSSVPSCVTGDPVRARWRRDICASVRRRAIVADRGRNRCGGRCRRGTRRRAARAGGVEDLVDDLALLEAGVDLDTEGFRHFEEGVFVLRFENRLFECRSGHGVPLFSRPCGGSARVMEYQRSLGDECARKVDPLNRIRTRPRVRGAARRTEQRCTLSSPGRSMQRQRPTSCSTRRSTAARSLATVWVRSGRSSRSAR